MARTRAPMEPPRFCLARPGASLKACELHANARINGSFLENSMWRGSHLDRRLTMI